MRSLGLPRVCRCELARCATTIAPLGLTKIRLSQEHSVVVSVNIRRMLWYLSKLYEVVAEAIYY